MSHILYTTAKSQSTDPRDAIFGVHGLLDRGSISSIALQPDYSLSLQQLFISLFAHLLLDLNEVEFLNHASGDTYISAVHHWQDLAFT